MSRPAERNVKTTLSRGLFVAMLTALIGFFSTAISAAETSQTWSVVIHIEYVTGFGFEHTLAVGVPTSTLPSILAECGVSHPGGAAVQYYYCYPVRE